MVRAGTEGFQSEQGPWSYLGAKALRGGGKAGPYVPDFDAVTTGSCRLLRVTADAYAAALRMGRAAEGRAADHIVGVRAVKQACHLHQPCPQPYALHLDCNWPRCAWAAPPTTPWASALSSRRAADLNPRLRPWSHVAALHTSLSSCEMCGRLHVEGMCLDQPMMVQASPLRVMCPWRAGDQCVRAAVEVR